MLEGLGAENSSENEELDDSGDNILMGKEAGENSEDESIPSDQIIGKSKKQRRARKDR